LRLTDKKKAAVAESEKRLAGYRQEIEAKYVQLDNEVVVNKTKKVLDYKKTVDTVRTCHSSLIEATVMLIEAAADVESLQERNQDINEQLARERTLVQEAAEKAKDAKARARISIQAVNEILAEAKLNHTEAFFTNENATPQGMTVEIRQHEIDTERSKLDYMHANNPNAIRDFERFKTLGDKVQEKIASAEARLDELAHAIAKIRGEWEPQLDALISQISDAFSHNFEQINCAGEVGVHKDEDFELWSIEIKVKFRYETPLARLLHHTNIYITDKAKPYKFSMRIVNLVGSDLCRRFSI